MREQLQDLLQKRVKQCVESTRESTVICEKIERKKESLNERKGEILKVQAKGYIDRIADQQDEIQQVEYHVHLQYFIRQKKHFYMEEEIERRQAEFYKGALIEDYEINPFTRQEIVTEELLQEEELERNQKKEYFKYDRLKAVQYAERWWNDYNPAYRKFHVDCTNYISQCLHTGGAPMRGYPDRGKGWWMQHNNWSYSWSVAHSFRWYLPSAKVGIRAKKVSSPDELLVGDVICYDFQGDGRYDHSTIVTGKDSFGMPLVNAHTANSRMRYWAYEDSTAYTPNIQYQFFTIVDDE